MANELNSDLKHKFYIRCIIDVCVFIVSILFFVIFAKIKSIAPYDTFLFMIILTTLNGVVFFITRLSTFSTIDKTINQQSSSITNAAQDILDIVASQKKTMEALSENTKDFSELINSLKTLSNASISTSKNTEKQINQSITFSQRESEAISSNAEKMLILRQKIQMIAELVLELSEHTQQIGSSISVVDDIAEQTNMLALNAAVEAARAGEHGKGFAVVAGEIRKLADESKQAITKITSLTSNIQYTTNSTVMATEEGSKEIEAVVKDINSLAADSDNLYNLIKDTLESLDLLNTNAKKREEIIEKLDNIDKKTTEISFNLMQNISANTEKIANLETLSKEIKNSVSEG